MAGISDKAIKAQYALNKYRYNGKELQDQEFLMGVDWKSTIMGRGRRIRNWGFGIQSIRWRINLDG